MKHAQARRSRSDAYLIVDDHTPWLRLHALVGYLPDRVGTQHDYLAWGGFQILPHRPR